MRRPKAGLLWLWLAGALLLAVAGGAALTAVSGGTVDPRVDLPERVAVTDPVTSELLRVTIRAPARLVPLRSTSIEPPPESPAVVSSMPMPNGGLVSSGEVILEVNGRPIFALHGLVPAWRDFNREATPGPDIEQLESALAEIGLLVQSPDRVMDEETVEAISALHAKTGYERDGTLERWQAVFLPSGVGFLDAPALAVGETLDDSVASVGSVALRAQVNLPPSIVDQLVSGLDAFLTAGDGEPIASGKLVEATLDPETLSGELLTVFVELDAPILRSTNESASLEIVLDETDGPVLTASAASVFSDVVGSGYYVVILEGELERRVTVEIGVVGPRRIEVTSNDPALTEGALLVLNPR